MTVTAILELVRRRVRDRRAHLTGSIAFRADPSFLAIDPAAAHLYAVSSATDQVGAYAIDPATGAPSFLNAVSAGGNGPTHLAVDRGGDFVLVANHNDGTVSVLQILATGALAPPQQTLATGANAHMIVTDPSNRHAFVPCLGSDHVAQYPFDAGTGMLAPNAVPVVATVVGAGPRHMAFFPDGAHAYVINELDSTMTAFALDGATGRLAPIHTVATRASGASGPNTTAEVWVHPSGGFVYGSNRGDDNIVVFARAAGDGTAHARRSRRTSGTVRRWSRRWVTACRAPGRSRRGRRCRNSGSRRREARPRGRA